MKLLASIALVACTSSSAQLDAAAIADFTVAERDFGCITQMTQVGDLRVANLAGSPDATIAAATGHTTFPAGSLVQLTPDEAMVKHPAGHDADTDDWEFFFLELSSSGTTILARGGTDVAAIMNGQPFGEACATCHAMAGARWDFICARDTDHACTSLPNDTAAQIAALQAADPRCGQ